jgi:hypothetical protein
MKRHGGKNRCYEIYRALSIYNGDGMRDLPALFNKWNYLAIWASICYGFARFHFSDGRFWLDVADYIASIRVLAPTRFKVVASGSAARGSKLSLTSSLTTLPTNIAGFIEARREPYSKERQYYHRKDPKYDEYGR